MRRAGRRYLTYANVTATLALVLSLTAGAYAAVQVTGKNVVNGSLTGKDIRAESIRGKHVRGLTLADLQDGPGQYYVKQTNTVRGNGLAEATATCNGNDAMISGGTVGGLGSFVLANAPEGISPNSRTAKSWTGRVQGVSGDSQVQVQVVALCLTVPE